KDTYGDTSKCTYIWSVTSNEWHQGPDLQTPRMGAACVVLHKKIYILGGVKSGQNSELDTCEVLDTRQEQKQWQKTMPMRESRVELAAVTYANCIYVFGGVLPNALFEKNGETIDRRNEPEPTWAERFDPVNNSWTDLPGAKRISFGCSAAVLDDMIYVIWGRKTCQQFNPQTQKWCQLKLPWQDHYAGALFPHQGNLFLAGGMNCRDTNEWTKDMDKYNPSTDEWERLPQILYFCIQGSAQLAL
ncbi:Kelch-like protein 29, partial [Cichlidogyrus casuarinus]